MSPAALETVGAEMISLHTGVPSSTVHKILIRHGLNRLSWIDRPTGGRSDAMNATTR